MDHESLRTASTYLNNLLLSRGLLRNGEPVDFVKPSKESRAQIINLVHDLILREDRDKDQREHVANTLRQLRSEDARKTHEIERLQARSEESARATAQAQQSERTANAEVKKVEKAMKALQDQATKLKTTLAQVRTQCANDVKKRDLELARLKTHLQGQQRGTRVGMAAPSMTATRKQTADSPHNVHDPTYSLKQETTEFLTQLSQSLSDENDGLITLIRTALGTMHDLLGTQQQHPDSAIGSMGSDQDKQKSGTSLLQAPPTSYEVLAADLENTLEHLKTILTNPNFVSLEEFEKEVETRDEEIESLREGWEHMEQRWLEVLGMMQGWVKRMNTGDTINMDDLRKGMGLVTPTRRGKKAQPPTEKENMEPEQSLSIVNSDTTGIDGPAMTNIENTKIISTSSPRQKSSLSASDGMGSLTDRFDRLDSPKRKRDVLEPPEFFDLRPSTASKSSRTSAPPLSPPKAKFSRAHSPNPILAATVEEEGEDESEDLEIPQMTIAEKLSAAQEEADQAAAARAGASIQASGRQPRRDAAPGVAQDGDAEREDDTLGMMPGEDTLGRIAGGSPMAKKTKIKGRPRKRKSTLSREEMESLVMGF